MKNIIFVNQTLENNVILARKHSKSICFCPEHLKNIEFLRKLFKKYCICAQNIWKECDFIPKTFGKYLILTQTIRKIWTFYPNIWKVSYFYLKHGKRYLLKHLKSFVSWPETFRTLVVTLQRSMRKSKMFWSNCFKQLSYCRMF